jgi:hypothetical protein
MAKPKTSHNPSRSRGSRALKPRGCKGARRRADGAGTESTPSPALRVLVERSGSAAWSRMMPPGKRRGSARNAPPKTGPRPIDRFADPERFPPGAERP